MAIKFSNNISTSLSAAINATDTSISLASATGLPSLGTGDYFYLTIDTDTASPTIEVVKVTAVSGTTLTVTRGQDGTTASAFDAGTKVELRVTAAALDDLAQAADTESVSISGDTMTGTLTVPSAVMTDTTSTGRGIYRNNRGYDLRLGGGTDSTTGAYLSISGDQRGGTANAYNGRLEYHTGGSDAANASSVLGDHVWYADYNGGSTHLMTLDSVTGSLNLKIGELEIGGTTVINSSRNLTNIGTISSGAITSSGNIAGSNLSVTSTNWIGFGDYGERISGSNANSSLTFYTDATQALQLDSSQNATFANDVTISGNLYVTGSTTSVNVEDLNVEQGEITLNYGSGDTSSAANGAGIRIQDAVDANTDATILWDATNDEFDFSHGATFGGNIYAPEYLIHTGNSGTYLRFQTDRATLRSGGGAIVDAHDNGNLYLTGTTLQVYGNYSSTGTISSGDITVSKGGTAGTDYPKLTLINSIESSAWSIGHTLGEIQFYNSDAQNAGPTAVIRNVNSNPDNQTTLYGNLEFLTTDPFDLDAVTSIMNVGITEGSRPSVYIGVEGPSYISNHEHGLGNLVIASSAGIAPSNSTSMIYQFAPTIRLEHMSDHNDWDSGDVIGQILFGANDHTTNDEVRARIIVEQDTDNQLTTDSRIVFETAAVDASTSEVLRLDSSKNATFAGSVTTSSRIVSNITSSIGIKTTYGQFAQFATDSQIDLVSSSDGTWGSAINLVEGNNTSNTDVWSIARKTTGGAGDSSLNFNFGTSNDHANTNRVAFSSTGVITWSGGGSANANTAYTYSQVGHLPLAGGTLSGTLDAAAGLALSNTNITEVNALSFNDPGPGEGISWSGGNWAIYESPDDLTTNTAGNLQFVSGGNRKVTFNTSGDGYFAGAVTTNNEIIVDVPATTGAGTGPDTFALLFKNTDFNYTADALTAFNATTSWDMPDSTSFMASSRPGHSSIWAHMTEVNGPVVINRFIQLDDAAGHGSGMVQNVFYQYDGAGTGTTDMKVPVGDLETWATYDGTNSIVEKFSISSAGSITASGGATFGGKVITGQNEIAHSQHTGWKLTATDDTAGAHFYAMYLDHNISGDTAFTGDFDHVGLFIDVDSSAQGGGTTEEHRIYGIYNDVRATGDSDLVVGSRTIGRADNFGSGQVTTIYGADNQAVAHNNDGYVATIIGARNYAQDSTDTSGDVGSIIGAQNLAYLGSSSTVDTPAAWGSWNIVQVSAAQNNTSSNYIPNVYGTMSEIQIDSDTSTNTKYITNAFGVYSLYDENDSDDNYITVTNSYLFYGDYQGTLNPTNPWGLYLVDTGVPSYIGGQLRMGTTDRDAGEPSYSFSGDTDTGMYLSTTNTLGFSTGGTNRLTITSSGLFTQDLTYDNRGAFNSSNDTGQIILGAYNGPADGTGTSQGPAIVWKPNYSGYTKESLKIAGVATNNYFDMDMVFYTSGTSDSTGAISERFRLTQGGEAIFAGNGYFAGDLNVAGGKIELDAHRFVDQKTYTGTSIFSQSGDWYTLCAISEHNTPAYFSLKFGSHSTMTFVVSTGYFGSNVATINVLSTSWTQNGSYPAASEIRVVKQTDNNAYYVQMKLTYSSASVSGFSLYARTWGGSEASGAPEFVSSLAVYSAAHTVIATAETNMSNGSYMSGVGKFGNDIHALNGILASEYIYHLDDTDTNLRFQNNRATLTSGGGAIVDAHNNGNLYLTGTTVQVYGSINSTGALTTGNTIKVDSASHAYLTLDNGGAYESGIIFQRAGTSKWEQFISSSLDRMRFYSYGPSLIQMDILDGVDGNGGTILSGLKITDGNGYYGSYGNLILNSNQSYTSTSRGWMITNGYKANQFAILYSSSATTLPSIDTTGGNEATGTSVALKINNTGQATFSALADFDNGITVSVGGSDRLNVAGGDVNVVGATDLQISGSSRRFSFLSGTGTIRTTTSNSLIFQTNSTTALTLNSSQNATFPGIVDVNSLQIGNTTTITSGRALENLTSISLAGTGLTAGELPSNLQGNYVADHMSHTDPSNASRNYCLTMFKSAELWAKNASTQAWSKISDTSTGTLGNILRGYAGGQSSGPISLGQTYDEFIIYFGTGTSTSIDYSFIGMMKLEHSTNGNTFVAHLETKESFTNVYESGWTKEYETNSISSWPGATSHKVSFGVGSSYRNHLRLRIVPNWQHASNGLTLYNVNILGNYGSRNSLFNWTHDRKVTFNNNTIFQGGSAASPSLTCIGDEDTGIYFPAANRVGISTGGTLALTIDSSQEARFFEGSGANRRLYIYGNDNGTDRYGSLSVGTDGSFNVVAADTYLILSANSYVQSNKPHNFIGNILMQGTAVLDTSRNLTNINTISSGAITVNNDGNALTINAASNGGTAQITMCDNGTNGSGAQKFYITHNHTDGSSYGSGAVLRFHTTESTGTILADGKLMFSEGLYLKPSSGTGAGTVVIQDNGTYRAPDGTAALPSLTFSGDSDTGFFKADTNKLGVACEGAEVARFIDPNALFHTNGGLQIGTTDVTISIDSSGSGINLLAGGLSTFNRAGAVVAAFNRTLSSSGTNGTGDLLFFNCQGSTVGKVTVTTSSASYSTASDQRLKENIVDAPSAGADIDAIQVRSFDWKTDGSHQKYGMVAQELLPTAPYAVSQGETEEDMMSVDYSKLVPMLVKEVQQLRERVAQQEAQALSLTKKIEELENDKDH